MINKELVKAYLKCVVLELNIPNEECGNYCYSKSHGPLIRCRVTRSWRLCISLRDLDVVFYFSTFFFLRKIFCFHLLAREAGAGVSLSPTGLFLVCLQQVGLGQAGGGMGNTIPVACIGGRSQLLHKRHHLLPPRSVSSEEMLVAISQGLKLLSSTEYE